MVKIIHIISLERGLGGFQRTFIPFYKYAQKFSKFKQYIFSNRNISKNYGHLDNFFKINININFFVFIKHVISKNSVIHLHNKLSSIKIYYLFKLLPVSNLIFHEHGSAWNIKTKFQKKIYQANAKLAKKIIVNSIATKNFLIKRFKINQNKIELAYYGFKDPKIKKKRVNEKIVKVGFIGRFDLFKGIHSLIEAANILKKKNIIFLIAGDGYLEKFLKKLSKGNKNIKFVGSVSKPLNFIKSLDILVVPSIREPLGFVNIEAGLCKTCVIASKIDGIPEVIENKRSGILIKPSKKITLKDYPDQPPLPDLVIDPVNFKTVKPRELDPKILSNSILYLSKQKKLRVKYGNQLYKNVKKKFTIEGYFKRIELIYENLKEN